jgi:alanine racemase
MGFGAENDVRATDVAIDWPHGTRFTLHVGHEVRSVTARLMGRHQLYSVLAAVAVARHLGLSLDSVLPRLEALAPSLSRLQPQGLPNGAWLLRDDFKGGLETFDAAFDTLAAIPARRRIIVLGDVDEVPGSAGPAYRRLGGRLAGIADHVVLIGGPWRRRYAVGAKQAGMAKDAIVDVKQDLAQATRLVQEVLGEGDVVLVKGRAEQRLARVSLALAGRPVRCTIRECHLTQFSCDVCPMLERGWGDAPVVA